MGSTYQAERKGLLLKTLWVTFLGSWYLVESAFPVNDAELNPDYWRAAGQLYIKGALKLSPNLNVAKNVIIFVGDGMGIPTVMAARVLKGQKMNKSGEETFLSFENFPYVGLSKTYSLDKQVPDSASTATAMFCGVKTNYRTIGISGKGRFNDCQSTFGNEVYSVARWAQDTGKDTGFVTTTRVTHATPAGLYAHTPHRDWEADKDLPPNASKCKDIAMQLLQELPGKNFKVILGGGRKNFFPVRSSSSLSKGIRKDGLDLTSSWMSEKNQQRTKAKYVSNSQELNAVDVKSTDYLLGLFADSHMQYEVDRNSSPKGEPSIAEMTKKAIEMLQKNPNGFFLMVEGGRIDHGHHDNLGRKALEDAVAMDLAVSVATNMTSQKDTLILVTADHSHVMTVNGYPSRGNDIFGFAGKSDMIKLPYTTLMYTNGPGALWTNNGSIPNLTDVDTGSASYRQLALFPLGSETHGGEDVGVYASGPMAHLIHGVLEQNAIAHVMGYAACIGPNLDHCKAASVKGYASVHTDSSSNILGHWGLVIIVIFYTQVLK